MESLSLSLFIQSQDPVNTCPSSESNGAGGRGEVGWTGGPGDLGKPSVDQSFWERALIWI